MASAPPGRRVSTFALLEEKGLLTRAEVLEKIKALREAQAKSRQEGN
ncbi:MAG: hypothetical protein QGH70_04290 [Nitrospinota bacterium]|nr:hypothetical protein [Nitrospinota bacterium]MDP6483055.1 hypothetical protein [Nitrospinota bacterium]MDP6619516.1 hypothetical protein [Nitrospinota bacterium]